MELSKRKKLRLENWNYAENGWYFITICTKRRQALLGNIVGNGFIRSAVGTIAEEQLNELNSRYQHVHVDKYVIMPNHIHMFLVLDGTETERINPFPTVSSIIGLYKAGVSRKVGFPIWQKSFYDHVIRNEEDYQMIWQYVDDNPLKWQMDRFYSAEEDHRRSENDG